MQNLQLASWRPRTGDVRVWSKDELAKGPGMADVPLCQLESSQAGGIPSYSEGQPLVLVGPSTDWIRRMHVRESNLSHSVY